MKNRSSLKYNLLKTALIGAIFAIFFGGFTYLLAKIFPVSLIAASLKYAIGIIGIVWLFSVNVYNKLSDVTDMPGLNYKQHRNLEIEVQSRLQFFWFRALFLAILSFLMAIPSLFLEAKIPLPNIILGVSGFCFGVAIYSLRHLLRELEEIRELRSYIKEVERKEKERLELVKLINDDKKNEFVPDEVLDGFRKSN